MTQAFQAIALTLAVVAFGFITSPAWAVFVGGVLTAVLLEMHDARKGGD